MVKILVRRLAFGFAAAAAAAGSVLVSGSAASQPGGFGDVAEDAYFSVPVASLAERGVFAGTECAEGFCPDEPLDRKTMAVWVVRVLDGADPAAVSESRFDDVNPEGFYARFVERMAELGVTTGCGDGSGFCPHRSVTRAEMAVFLSRAYDLPEAADAGFVDVPADAWYAADVARLAASEITTGCGDGTGFCPNRDTTRAQMATFLWRGDLWRAEDRADAAPEPEPSEPPVQRAAAIAAWNALRAEVRQGGVWTAADAARPPTHPDTDDPSWDRGTWQPGGGLPDDRPRRSPNAQVWIDWCDRFRDARGFTACDTLLFHMTWALDYLAADDKCVVEIYFDRALEMDTNYHAGLRGEYGWHQCPSLIDPLQPDGRLLSQQPGVTIADRCRAVLPEGVELEYSEGGSLRTGLDCDQWGQWLESLRISYPTCERSARLAEEWLEHYFGMPERYRSISC